MASIQINGEGQETDNNNGNEAGSQPIETESAFVQNLETLQGDIQQQVPADQSEDFASQLQVPIDGESIANAAISQKDDVEEEKLADEEEKAAIDGPSNDEIQDVAGKGEEEKNEAVAEAAEADDAANDNALVENDVQNLESEAVVKPSPSAQQNQEQPDSNTGEHKDLEASAANAPTEIIVENNAVDSQPLEEEPQLDQQQTFTDQNGVQEAPSSTKSSTTRPILSQVGTIEQVISKKLPKLKERIASSDNSLQGQMLKALEEKQHVFEQAFITIKQEEQANRGESRDAEKDERIDMVNANLFDNIVAYLGRELGVDLAAFDDFFKANYSQIINGSDDQTLTLAQFTQAYLEYIEATHSQSSNVSPADNTEGKYLFGENFYIFRQDLISQKLGETAPQIQRIMDQVGDQGQLPLGRLREFWLQLTLATRSVMVQRGSEYKPGQRVMDDPQCLDQLHKHVCTASARSDMPGAGEFEAAYSSDPLQFDEKLVSQDFLLREIEAFFLDNRKVMLIDLMELENLKPKIDEEQEEEVKQEEIKVSQKETEVLEQEEELNLDLKSENIAIEKSTASPERIKETPNKAVSKKATPIVIQKSKKQPTVPVDPFGERPAKQSQEPQAPRYVEKDANYVPPAAKLPDERQKVIDNNLLEVFNFYCRRFAAVRGDFTQKNQNLVVLGLQGFTRFAKDFKVPLTAAELTTVWKKSSNNHQPLEFEQFQKSIALLGLIQNKSNQDKLTVRQKQLRKELKKRNELQSSTSQQNASAKDANEKPVIAVKPLKTSLEKMTEQEIKGELILLPRTIGRASILSEDQSRIQMYELLEIEFPERYRSKLPTTGQNELNSNILQTKKLINGDLTSSAAGGSKAVSQSAVSNVVARLTSNPPVKDRSQIAITSDRNSIGAAANKDFVKDIRQRGKTQARPVSLLSPAPSATNLQANTKPPNALLPVSSHSQNAIESKANSGRNAQSTLPPNAISAGSAFQRKKTELHKQNPALQKVNEAPAPRQKSKEYVIQKGGPTSPTQQDRSKLAEIHKRIRVEKQNTGRVLSVNEAKKQIEDEKKGGVAPKTKVADSLNRKLSQASIKSKASGREKMTPSKILPLSQINQSKRAGVNQLVNKTPSMIDLTHVGEAVQQKEKEYQPLPDSLNFEDIQKMRLTSLNRFGSKEDEFRPQDFLDLESQDSDNEILAKFKPEVVLPDSMLSKPLGQNEMLSLLQPNAYEKQFAPPPLIQTNNLIDEQTGYSNSPKFSVYRLNNQSNMKDVSQYEDQQQREQNQHYRDQFFPPNDQSIKVTNEKKTGSKPVRSSTKNLAAARAASKQPIKGKTNANQHAVPITTPQSQKGKAANLKKNNVRGGLGGVNGNKANSSNPNIEVGNFESHSQLPFADGADQAYMDMEFERDSKATPTPDMNMNENISEIGIPQKNDGEAPSLGDISMFNDGNPARQPLGSPGRRPAQQIIDDQRSILSKQPSGAHIGEGLAVKPPILTNSRHQLKVGSARISSDAINTQHQNDAQIESGGANQNQQLPPKGSGAKRRLGQIAQTKRSSSKPAAGGVHSKAGGRKEVARYTNSARKDNQDLRMSSDSQLPQRNHNKTDQENAYMAPGPVGAVPNGDHLLMRQASQVVAGSQMMPDGQQLKSLLPAQLSREDGQGSTNGSRKVITSNSAVSSSNQRSLMRAQEAQRKETQDKQRRLDGLLNLQDKNLQKGLSAVSRR